MKMACQAMNMWSLSDLVGAFLDLAFVYMLLCVSCVAYLASKFLGFIGLKLPCPCDGLIFNVPNNDYCISKLLVDLPIQKVCSVNRSVKQKYPFNGSVWDGGNNNVRIGAGDFANRIVEIISEGSSSSVLDAKMGRIGVEEELSGEKYDMKGKGVVDHRPRSRLRHRRKRGGRGICVAVSSYDRSVREEAVDDKKALSVMGMRQRLNEFEDEDMQMKKNSMSTEGLQDSALGAQNLTNGDEDAVNLEQELEEERTARAALYIELEKERSAAASAAEEAMSMIQRLQEEKASIEMEARQYQRILEEKSAYDAEEMNILKEILVRREKEKLFLENEVEEYREMISLRNEQLSNLTPNGSHESEFVDTSVPPEGREENNDAHIYDVHVVDNPINFYSEVNASECLKLPVITKCSNNVHERNSDQPEASVTTRVNYTNCPSTSLEDEVNVKRSNSDITSGLPPIGPKGKLLLSDLRRNSISAMDCEMVKIDSEIGKLRERLRLVHEGREKLSFSAESRETENIQLNLLEDIARQVQEIRYLTSPRKAANQVLSNERRSRSVSSVFQRNFKG